MLFDLFSSMDYWWGSSSLSWGSWVSGLVCLVLLGSSWVWGGFVSSLLGVFGGGFLEGSEVGGQWKFKGYFGFVSSLFFFIFTLKVWGLFPYIFGVTTHVAVTLSLSFVAWVIVVFSSMAWNPVLFLGHLTPSYSPLWLSPLLKVMELVSLFVRYITLSLRLSINMSTGHIFVSLLGSGLVGVVFWSGGWFMVILMVMSGYFMFEFGISLIQGFVFSLLLNQYLEDHP